MKPVNDMRSVMTFDPWDSEEETEAKWNKFCRNNPNFMSAVGDKAVPNVQQTQEYLRRYTG